MVAGPTTGGVAVVVSVTAASGSAMVVAVSLLVKFELVHSTVPATSPATSSSATTVNAGRHSWVRPLAGLPRSGAGGVSSRRSAPGRERVGPDAAVAGAVVAGAVEVVAATWATSPGMVVVAGGATVGATGVSAWRSTVG